MNTNKKILLPKVKGFFKKADEKKKDVKNEKKEVKKTNFVNLSSYPNTRVILGERELDKYLPSEFNRSESKSEYTKKAQDRMTNEWRKAFENGLEWNPLVTICAFERKDGTYILGDGAHRFKAQVRYLAREMWSAVDIKIFSYKDMTENEFLDKMIDLNSVNGKNWVAYNKCEDAMNRYHSKSATHAIDLYSTYDSIIPFSVASDITYGDSYTTKQGCEKRYRSGEIWRYAEEFATFFTNLCKEVNESHYLSSEDKKRFCGQEGCGSVLSYWKKSDKCGCLAEYKDFMNTYAKKFTFIHTGRVTIKAWQYAFTNQLRDNNFKKYAVLKNAFQEEIINNVKDFNKKLAEFNKVA